MKQIALLFLVMIQTATAQNSFFDSITVQNIGPTIMSGRVVDLAVNPDNPIEFYVAYATGGLWYTQNNGTSFTPVMDAAETLNCGSVTVDWKSGAIWVGTGEVNASRSSYSGVGVLKSSDKGKTWENLGLSAAHHISRIWVNPTNLNEIVVATVGHLYTTNKERGIYKSTDGGKTWKQTLFVADDAGIIDLAVSKSNPKIMFAAAWQKDRKAWNFDGDGEKSGIYKSEDGGTTWKLVSTKTSGFPNNEGVGRIGLALFNDTVIYAVLDNQNKRLTSTTEQAKDANAALFETNVIGCEVYKSEDGGASWKKTHDQYIDDMYYTYGYYFANITVHASNQNCLYIGGVPLLRSRDGGKTFASISKENVHADHHVTWVNPFQSNHIINGNDGGVNISYDDGENWIKCNTEALGQLYAVNVDNDEEYNVYGGLQDNGVWVGNHNYEKNVSWHQEGKYPYEELMGGDGMQIQIDSRNSKIVYTGFQFGNYYRIDRENNRSEFITPKSPKGEKPFRFNWQTPITLSSHNQDVVYLGSNFLHRSMDQGKTWTLISDDLTCGGKEGNVAFGTLTTISESTFQFGLLYVGSDDGKLHVSKNGGASWTLLSSEFPQNLWVSRVVASLHKKERVYVTLNGYRSDDFTSYVYVSEDYGTTWTLITNGLTQAVNALIEDTTNENILFAGTDNGLFISLTRGTTWQKFSIELPNVAVHDLKIQATAKDLIVGTHGRSIYKIELAKIQELTPRVLAQPVHLFPLKDKTKSERWGTQSYAWGEMITPMQEVWFYLKQEGTVHFTVSNEAGTILFSTTLEGNSGLNKFEYDYSFSKTAAEKWNKKDKNIRIKTSENNKFYLPIGKYKLSVTTGKQTESIAFNVNAPKK